MENITSIKAARGPEATFEDSPDAAPQHVWRPTCVKWTFFHKKTVNIEFCVFGFAVAEIGFRRAKTGFWHVYFVFFF